ncbi:hypothetical protein [Streptomyces sp. NPDC086777]
MTGPRVQAVRQIMMQNCHHDAQHVVTAIAVTIERLGRTVTG